MGALFPVPRSRWLCEEIVQHANCTPKHTCSQVHVRVKVVDEVVVGVKPSEKCVQ